MKNIKLNNDKLIPSVGLGTWLIDNDKVEDVIKTAVSLGYRHIDTAQAYENEEGVGLGIKNCGIPREKLFITSKIRAEHKDYDSAKRSIDESLEKLGIDYLDLMIIHAPQPWVEFRETDNKYYLENKLSIVSNFLIRAPCILFNRLFSFSKLLLFCLNSIICFS